MATEQKKEEGQQGEKIQVDGTEVYVKTPPPSKVRPAYYCQTCDSSFPSQLDLDEHRKFDHDSSNSKNK